MPIARFSFKSIRLKFVVSYSLMTVCFVLILFFVLYLKERQRVFEVALNNSTQISNLHSDVISQELQGHIASLYAISVHDRVKSGDVPFIISKLQLLQSMSGSSVLNTVFVDENWNVVDYRWRRSKVDLPDIIKDERWQKSDYHISAPHIGVITKIPVVALGVPVYDDLGHWRGLVSISISINYLTNRLSRVKIGNSSYAWISDDKGTVVSHPDSQLVMKANIFQEEGSNFDGLSSIAQKTRLNEAGYGHYYDQSAHKAKIVTFSKIMSLPGWTLFVTTEEDDVLLDIRDLLEDVAITSLVVVIVFMPVIVYLTNSITRPIVELTRNVKNAVNNSYTQFTAQASQDEIGQLSHAFKDTIEEIQHHNRKLGEMVERRTAELNRANRELEKSVYLLNENNQKLTWLAMYDPLTNLYNRRALFDQVEQEISRAKRHNLPISLILIDLDHFKEVNDTFGHDIGDQILRQVSMFLSQNSRKENIIARWGGEEFVILAVESIEEQAEALVQRLLIKLREEDFSPVEHLTFSAGVATLKEKEGFESLVIRADKALYLAKQSGRSCVKTSTELELVG